MSTAKNISFASLIMMGSVLLSRLLGIVREQVLAALVGTSGHMDAYVAAFLLPEFLNHLLAGGFMSITFIPLFQKHLLANDFAKASRMFSNIFTTGTLIMAALILVCVLFTREVLGLFGSRVGGGDIGLAIRMTRIILPAQLFFYWGALFMAVQFARKQFFIPALAPLFYNGGIILGGVVLGRRFGVEGFAWGVLAGAFIGNAAVQLIGMRGSRLRFIPIVDFKDRDLITYVLISLPLVLGLGMQFSNEIFFRIFGAFLGEGGLASLNYSLRTMWVLVGIFGQAVGIASFPFLSSLAMQGKLDEMNRVAFGVVRKVGILLLPASAVAAALAPEVVRVLFQHGRFNAHSTAATAPVLQLYLVGAFAFGAITIVTRCFYALQNTLLPMIVSSIVAILSIPLYWLLGRMLGAPGIALAGSIAAVVLLAALTTIWTRRSKGGVYAAKTLTTYGIVLAAAALGGGVSYYVKIALWGVPQIQASGVLAANLVVALIAGGAGLCVCYAVLLLLRVEDVRGILQKRAKPE